MGKTGWKKEAQGSVLGMLSLDAPWEPLLMTGLPVSPSPDQAPPSEPLLLSPTGAPGRSAVSGPESPTGLPLR